MVLHGDEWSEIVSESIACCDSQMPVLPRDSSTHSA